MVDLEQMLDLTTPWCLRVAATLRIPEHIAAGHAGIGPDAADPMVRFSFGRTLAGKTPAHAVVTV